MKAKISCIGTGAMGGAIMRAVCKKFDAWNVAVTSKNPEHAKAFAEELIKHTYRPGWTLPAMP